MSLWQRVARTGTLDYRYWQNQVRFARSCTFDIPHEANRVKLALARFTGRLIAPFVAG